MTATDREIEQLAMFTAAVNAKLYGYSTDGGPFRPSWDDLGPIGQEAYLKDARLQFEAVELIQSRRKKTPSRDKPVQPWGSRQHCDYELPHPAHNYEQQSPMPFGHSRKLYCPGLEGDRS